MRTALLAAGRNDLAEQLNSKYNDVHSEADKKLRSNNASNDGILNRIFWPNFNTDNLERPQQLEDQRNVTAPCPQVTFGIARKT